MDVKNSADGDFGVKNETRDTDSRECLKTAGRKRVSSAWYKTERAWIHLK